MFFFFFCKNRYFDAPTLQLQENGETAMLSNAYLSESCKKVRRLFFAFCGRKKNPEILNFQNRWLERKYIGKYQESGALQGLV